MVNNKMFIPAKIKVGYQNRQGTYTGKLAYVIYFDERGKLRKEKSWEGWRDDKIKPNDFDNEPIDGFVLNKGVGGVKDSWSSWNTRNEYIRVYDPRDFEFEISVANLLFILQETSSIKGKGLEGEFVYAWSGKELILLPVSSMEYKECKEHTERQNLKLSAKDIKEGFSYVMKNSTNVLYLGKCPFNRTHYNDYFSPIGKKHVFLNLDNPNPKYGCPYFAESGFTKIAECSSTTALQNYPDEVDRFRNSKNYGYVTKVRVERFSIDNLNSSYYSNRVFLKSGDDKYKLAEVKVPYYNSYSYIRESKPFSLQIKDGEFKIPATHGSFKEISRKKLEKIEMFQLYVTLKNGKEKKVR